MGTTLTGLFFYRERTYVLHVGDSRAFLLRGGVARQLTSDHSWLNEQVQAGALSPAEAAASDLKHIITRSVGFEQQVHADIVPVSVIYGDAFLLCTDGMSNYIESDELGRLGLEHWYGELPRICTDLANKRGGDDNITVVTVLACNDHDERIAAPAQARGRSDTLPPGYET
jgi:protein phosphatase